MVSVLQECEEPEQDQRAGAGDGSGRVRFLLASQVQGLRLDLRRGTSVRPDRRRRHLRFLAVSTGQAGSLPRKRILDLSLGPVSEVTPFFWFVWGVGHS